MYTALKGIDGIRKGNTMKSKLFLAVLLLAAISTIGISQDKQPFPTYEDILMERARIRKLPYQVGSLVGVEGISILIERLYEDAKATGLTREQVKTDIELKLRRAGIKVNSEQEWLASEDRAELYVRTNTTNSDSSRNRVYAISLELKQNVTLARGPYAKVMGATWDKAYVGICPKSKFPDIARQAVKDLTDKFISDYLAANPKR